MVRWIGPRKPKIDDLPERLARGVRALPPPLGMFFLLVVVGFSPKEAARKVGFPPEEAEIQLLLARSMLAHLTFEEGEPRS